jgi:hypothetical protein
VSRRPSHKPKPKPGPSVLTVTKNTAAIGQLESAMLLWFNGGDPVSILVLASNAEDCLHALGTKVGKPSEYKTWLNLQASSVQEQSRYIQDFAKHGFKDLDEDALFSSQVAEVLMYFGGRCYRDLFGQPTALMFAFEIRFGLENPDLVRAEAKEVIANLGSIENPADVTRQQFLEKNLPLIERLLAKQRNA